MRIFLNNSNSPHSTWNRISHTGIRLLLTAALTIIGLGILILLSPILLFFFVAGLALVAITFLTIAWKVHRIKKSTPTPTSNDPSRRIHVESHTFDIDHD